jgi:hypothetical protein
MADKILDQVSTVPASNISVSVPGMLTVSTQTFDHISSFESTRRDFEDLEALIEMPSF